MPSPFLSQLRCVNCIDNSYRGAHENILPPPSKSKFKLSHKGIKIFKQPKEERNINAEAGKHCMAPVREHRDGGTQQRGCVIYIGVTVVAHQKYLLLLSGVSECF